MSPNGFIGEIPRGKKKEPSKWEKFFTYAQDVSTGYLKSQAEIRKAQIEQQYKTQQTKQESGLKFLQAQYGEEQATQRMQQHQQLIAQREKAAAERKRLESIASEEREWEIEKKKETFNRVSDIQKAALEEYGVPLTINRSLPLTEQLRTAMLGYQALVSQEQAGTRRKISPTGKLTSTQQVNKSNALSVLRSGGVLGEPFRDATEAEAYVMDNFKVDVNDPDIRAALNQIKPVERRGLFR